MTKSEKIEYISILQRSKIIIAIEAVVVNSSVALGVYLVNRFIEGILADLLIVFGIGWGIGFSVYACTRNIKKHNLIKKLQSEVDMPRV